MKKLNPETYYSLKKLHEMNAIPWITTFKTLQKFIDKQRKAFKPIISGVGNGRRYLIKGENLIKFLDKVKKEGLII